MQTRERIARHAWTLSLLSACAPLPSELEAEGACGPEVELPAGVTVAAASDPFVTRSPCGPTSFMARDVIRSADVEAHGSGGLVFNPLSGGAENECDPVGCHGPPCASECGTGGTYTRVYERACDSMDETVWGELRWDASIPIGASIVFELRTADSLGSLATAVVVRHVVTPTSASSVRYLARLLYEAGAPPAMPHLELRAVLESSASLRATPTLRSFSLEVACGGD